MESTTGLATRTASVLSYLGWWVTGLIFWGVERRDQLVRFHAAQATIAFGALALLIGVLLFLSLLMLSFAPVAFQALLAAAGAVWLTSLGLWVLALWQAGQGKRWRIPLAARLAEAWTAERQATASGPASS